MFQHVLSNDSAMISEVYWYFSYFSYLDFSCNLMHCDSFLPMFGALCDDGSCISQDGYTALIYAVLDSAQWGRTECVRLLIDAGADTNSKDNVRVAAAVHVLKHSCVKTFI